MTSRDDLRIGDAERDEVMTALREHFAQGRLTHDELDERLDTALGARTVGDLRRVTADLPEQRSQRPAAYDAPWRPEGMPLPPRGDLGTWGHHMADLPRPPFQGRRRHGGPPVFLIILAVFLVASAVGGAFAPLLGLLKVLFIMGVVFAIVRLAHHRHHGHPHLGHHHSHLGRRHR
ncbi:DUF1707 SHOCT-like domain-containing protein [Sphaerisporangium corydalis]|uniref:DUF1707 domain-containing protein n=1 Tax=Sphaerisporangium corydalis TaxID=1441875 RepID=A0ABV9ED33_9ACTN|nr:DUF1707 domain-containing protein [Sphaerisporangium corydalis]